ncbi:MAG: ATP-binding cassette domain-containing protein, partial [Acidimicrobiia bacterium]
MSILAPGETVLDVREAHVRHGHIHAVRDVAVEVRAGEIVGLIGPNGAGKTSLLRGIVGVGPCQASAIRLLGEDVRRLAPHRRARRGMVLVPEGRSLFSDLTVQQNLRVPQVARRSEPAGSLEEVLTVFPLLRDRLGQRAGSLSGGQQQMLAIGRALVSSPRILLLDEVSRGL